MSRRASKHTNQPRPLSAVHPSAQIKEDGRWIVQYLPGAMAVKTYRCPGCSASIAPGLAHIVAWPDTPAIGTDRAVDDRRHWHRACWDRRR